MKKTVTKIDSIIIALIAIFLVSCGTYHVGSSHNGFSDFPENNISVYKAISLAEKYLDKTFELRKANRSSQFNDEPAIWVTLRGNYYHIVKDNYPSYSPGFYEKHAVRINKSTGEVYPPK
jgi:hypothetical protein